MLQGDFFTISSIRQEQASSKVMLELNAKHSIFEGHFPGQPVVPGACLLQMVKEIMQHIAGKELQLVKAHHLKFISLIDPSENNILQMTVTHSLAEKEEIPVTATLLYDTTVCFKFNGIFQILQ